RDHDPDTVSSFVVHDSSRNAHVDPSPTNLTASLTAGSRVDLNRSQRCDDLESMPRKLAEWPLHRAAVWRFARLNRSRRGRFVSNCLLVTGSHGSGAVARKESCMRRRGCLISLAAMAGLVLVCCLVGWFVLLPRIEDQLTEGISEGLSTQVAEQLDAAGVDVGPGTHTLDVAQIESELADVGNFD